MPATGTEGGVEASEEHVRQETLRKLHADPEHYLTEYSKGFGNVLNADDAATLFDEYNGNPTRYRVAVHPAATWIRDELLRRALAAEAPKGKNRVVFTAGGNAAGKSTALSFTKEGSRAQAVFDSTFSNPDHAGTLVDQVLAADKRVTILYINRPLEDAFRGMLDRASQQGRVVTIVQLINSHQGAIRSVRRLWAKYHDDPRVEFRFVDNSGAGPRLGTIELATEQDYTEIRERLYDLLDGEYQNGRITEVVYLRIGRR
jgi:hypothetical protein